MSRVPSSWLAPALLSLLGAVAIATGVLRLLSMHRALASGGTSDASDLSYVTHPLLASLHILPGIAFMLLGPLQFVPSILVRWPKVHRWSGRLFVVSGVLTALTAMGMAIVFPVFGGVLPRAAFFTFGVAQIGTLLVALSAALRRNIPQHRAWMIRAFAIGLSVATMRLFFGVAFVAVGEVEPNAPFVGPLVWAAFLFNTLVAEALVRARRSSARVEPPERAVQHPGSRAA